MHVDFVISMVNAALSLQSIEGEMEETKKRHRTDLWRLSAMCPARQSSTIFGDCYDQSGSIAVNHHKSSSRK